MFSERRVFSRNFNTLKMIIDPDLNSFWSELFMREYLTLHEMHFRLRNDSSGLYNACGIKLGGGQYISSGCGFLDFIKTYR